MSLRDRLKPYAQWATWPYRNSPEEDIKTMLTGAEAATHIEQDLLALIGEDENKTVDNGHDCYDKDCTYCDNSIRDELRAELRTAITAYCKGETI